MSEEDDVRSKLLAAGWKQGTCIDAQEALKTIPDVSEYHKQLLESESNCLLIITLYDCAVINDSFEKEPLITYVIAKPIDGINPNNALSKNSRTLHFNLMVDGKEYPFEINAGSFGVFCRKVLLSLFPLRKVTFDEKTKRVFLKWIQRRITQATFPDNFDRRLNKNKRSKLFDKYDDKNVTGVYLRLSPRHAELPESEVYDASIIVAVSDSEARKFMKENETALLMQLDSFFNSLTGINLIEKQIFAEGQLTLSLLRDYDLWSPEYNSFKSNPEGIPPVDLDG
ncbi:hypothetical protein [Thiothrix winogradskyi]|uniref:Uncharacterized protein n=1 Tax=Thiothrix winogradskyi TaxID=96472 RepID=A0ABY3T1P9_9GAMM|nr:hypothetical protein [Thiothrix winogradskyi]UJS25338.1 hypothetical protein L2Y54_04670 [Thiothrix winogradskyi]